MVLAGLWRLRGPMAAKRPRVQAAAQHGRVPVLHTDRAALPLPAAGCQPRGCDPGGTAGGLLGGVHIPRCAPPRAAPRITARDLHQAHCCEIALPSRRRLASASGWEANARAGIGSREIWKHSRSALRSDNPVPRSSLMSSVSSWVLSSGSSAGAAARSPRSRSRARVIAM
jgi:hypothetical protein